jgi:hypothetical protein
MTMEN